MRSASRLHDRIRAGWVLLLALLALAFAPSAAAYSIEVPDFGVLERQLRIRPSQKAQFDSAVQASQRALMAVAIAGLQVKETLNREFRKPFPDLNVLYRAHEEVLDLTLPNFREAGVEWERLYRMLDRTQVDMAKRFLRDHLGQYAPDLR